MFFEQHVFWLAILFAVYVTALAYVIDAARRRDVAGLQAQIDGLISGMERQGQVVDCVLDAIDAIRGKK